MTSALGAPRWRGQAGRVEVWYATVSDGDGTGYWIHCETVAPTDGEPYAHGWAAIFPVDAEPIVERFGPEPMRPPDDAAWFSTETVTIGPGRMCGTAGDVAWDLEFDDAGAPLWTFPRTVWERELLPGAQIVPWPNATVRGSVRSGSSTRAVDGHGAVARIYGHGNAQRWCWLHAALDDGSVLEVVSATPRRPGLRRLPLLAMVQLRRPGAPDWPARPLLAAVALRTRVDASSFRISGVVGRRRLRVDVTLPPDRCVALTYTDPDGASATCTNSERADAVVELARWRRGWSVEGWWAVNGTAHAEIGTRSAVA